MFHASLAYEITRIIQSEGPITFARFMELALYSPGGGYYTRLRLPGNDYYTAPVAHPAFGALLALQLEEMWRALGQPACFVVLEPGAGSGRLGADIADYAAHLSRGFARSLDYVTIDRAAASSRRHVRAAGLPFRSVTGCILSNELFDALPVHRVVMRNGRLREVYVGHSEGALAEVENEPSTPALAQRLQEEGIVLEEGQHTEVCLLLESWLQEAGAALGRGFVLTIDYGHEAPILYRPDKVQGTLRCYYRHTLSANPYVRVGDQDITAHVDFTALQLLGKRYGLGARPLTTQRAFLANLGLPEFRRSLAGMDLPQEQRDANRMGMVEIARAGGMGDFKVLVQYKGVEAVRLTGLDGPTAAWKDRVAALPVPLLTGEHMPLLQGAYPAAAQSFDHLWR